MCTRKELNNIKGITHPKINKMIEVSQKIEGLGFFKRTIVLSKREKIKRIKTESSNIDKLLMGGKKVCLLQKLLESFVPIRHN